MPLRKLIERGFMNGDDAASDVEFVFDQEKSERLSRFLALVLRHRAPQFDLHMDDEGFVDLDDLLDVIDDRQPALDWVEVEHLEALTRTEGRKRFEIRGDQIRATYGHSFHRPISYPPAEPPESLYVGALRTALPDLRVRGLLPHGRQYVHLSVQESEAEEIARHQGENATVVTVWAAKAHAAGVPFYHPTQGIYLVSKMPPEFLDVGVEYGRRGRKTRRR